MEKKECVKIKFNVAIAIIVIILLTSLIIVCGIHHIVETNKQTNQRIAENVVISEIEYRI